MNAMPTMDDLMFENQQLQQHIAELEQQLSKQTACIKQFQALLEHEPDCIGIMGLEDGTLCYANPAFRLLSGLNGHTQGTFVSHMVIPEEQEQLRTITNEVLTMGEWHGIVTYRGRNGELFHGKETDFLLRDEFGTPEAIGKIIQPIDTHTYEHEQAVNTLHSNTAKHEDAHNHANAPHMPVQFTDESIYQNLAEHYAHNTLLQDVIDNLPSAIFIKDSHGRVVLANKQLDDMFQAARGSLIGKTSYDILPDATLAENVWQSEHTAMVTGISLEREEVIPMPDGSFHTHLTVKFPVCNSVGVAYAVGGILTDIQDRIEMVETLRESEERFRTIADFTYDWEYWRGRESNFLYVSPACERITGYPAQAFMKNPDFFLQIVHPLDRERVAHTISQSDVLDTTQTQKEFDFRIITRTGDERWIGNASMPVYGNDGMWLGTRGSNRDITQQKQTERSLLEEQHFISTILDTVGALVMVLAPDGMVMRFNPACEHATDYAANEVIGKHVWDMFVPTNERDAVQSVFNQLSTGMDANSYEGLWITRNEKQLLVKWTYTALRDDEGNIAFIIGTGMDVTALRQGEHERLQLKEQVIDAQKAAIRELSTLLIPLSDNLIAMPLVGTIDSTRAQQVMETLLQGVQNTDAEFVILDITGVSVVDTHVADVLIQAANAVRLLGAQVIITGIRPDVAQTLVHLGTNLGGIITCSTLQRGIAYAAGKR